MEKETAWNRINLALSIIFFFTFLSSAGLIIYSFISPKIPSETISLTDSSEKVSKEVSELFGTYQHSPNNQEYYLESYGISLTYDNNLYEIYHHEKSYYISHYLSGEQIITELIDPLSQQVSEPLEKLEGDKWSYYLYSNADESKKILQTVYKSKGIVIKTETSIPTNLSHREVENRIRGIVSTAEAYSTVPPVKYTFTDYSTDISYNPANWKREMSDNKTLLLTNYNNDLYTIKVSIVNTNVETKSLMDSFTSLINTETEPTESMTQQANNNFDILSLDYEYLNQPMSRLYYSNEPSGREYKIIIEANLPQGELLDINSILKSLKTGEIKSGVPSLVLGSETQNIPLENILSRTTTYPMTAVTCIDLTINGKVYELCDPKTILATFTSDTSALSSSEPLGDEYAIDVVKNNLFKNKNPNLTQALEKEFGTIDTDTIIDKLERGIKNQEYLIKISNFLYPSSSDLDTTVKNSRQNTDLAISGETITAPNGGYPYTETTGTELDHYLGVINQSTAVMESSSPQFLHLTNLASFSSEGKILSNTSNSDASPFLPKLKRALESITLKEYKLALADVKQLSFDFPESSQVLAPLIEYLEELEPKDESFFVDTRFAREIAGEYGVHLETSLATLLLLLLLISTISIVVIVLGAIVSSLKKDEAPPVVGDPFC